MNNFEKIKKSNTVNEMMIDLERLLFEFATTRNIMSNEDLKQWLESEIME